MGVDPNPKNQPLERCEDTLEMFPAVPADEVEKPPVRPPQRPPARRKEKTLVLLRYTIGKQMLAYFLPSVILSSYTNAKKRQFCLGSITKCHVTRYGGGLQSRAKNKAPFEKTPSCGFFHNGNNSLLGVSFYLCLGWSANSPRRFARGGWNMRRQPCKS